MKFQLKCLRNNQIEYWTYDNVKNVVYDPQGEDRLKQFKCKEYKRYYPCNGEDTKFEFEDYVTDFYIVLGLKCNFHCKYCHQTDLPRSWVEEATPAKIDQLIDLIKQSGLRIDKNLLFWGGEPLVYWKTLKYAIPKLREFLPDIKFSIVTNGSLLNDEKFEFFKKYNVDICISYDGHHTLRDYPVFDNKTVFEATKKALHNGGHISILPLVNNVSDMPQDIKKDMCNRFEHNIGVGFHSIAKCDSNGASFIKTVTISEERLKQYYDTIYEMLHKDPSEIEPSLLDRFEELRGSIARGIPVDSFRSSCSVHLGNHIVVDINGDILLCMNYPFKSYGNLKDYKNVKITGFYSHQLKKKCMSCPYVNACFGVCPIIKDEDGPEFTVNCHNYKPCAEAMFKSAIDTLYGVRVIDIVPLEQ